MSQPPAFFQGFNIQTRQMKVDEAQNHMQGICQQLFGLLFQFYTLPNSEKGEKIVQGYNSAKALFQQLQQDTAAFFESTDPQDLSKRKENEMNSCKRDEEEEKLSHSMIDLDYIEVLYDALPAGYTDTLQNIIIKQKALTEIVNQISQKVTFSVEEQIIFYGIQSFILGPTSLRKQISLKEKNAFSSYFRLLQNELSQSLNKLTEICSYLEQEAEGQQELFSKHSSEKIYQSQRVSSQQNCENSMQQNKSEQIGNTGSKHERKQVDTKFWGSKDQGCDDQLLQYRHPKGQNNINDEKFESQNQVLPKMQLFIQTLTGTIHTIEVQPTQTIESIKCQFFEKEGIPQKEQRLVFKGRQLEDERTVRDYNINKDDTIHLILRLRTVRDEQECFLKADRR